MNISTLIDIASMPGMDLAFEAALELGKAVQNIKVYRTQCRDLSVRCTKLLVAFRDQCQGLEGSDFTAAADEVSYIIERAHRKAQVWASWNRIKSLVNQGDIKLGLEQLYKDIDSCAQHFNIAASAGLHRTQRELQLIHERDIADNREILRSILQGVDGLKDVLSDPNLVRPIMQTIQEQLQEESVQPEQSRELQQGLYEIHRKTQYLPPIVDLTGQIERTSKTPSAYGAYNDVYTGLWLGEEKVALKFARLINHTEKARKRFHKEVEIWRDLQHRHICRLYGIFYEEDQIYSVSPWMECGSALDYINSTDEVINRVVILGDVASGMEYLHGRGVVHGDLRAANVLIGDDGRACVSDFGLSRVIEEVGPDMSSTTQADMPIRWQSPELMLQDENEGPTPASDVWSFGMLCLEILTGKKPYHGRPNDVSVIRELDARRLPARPTDEAIIRRGLDDKMWNLMLQCWNWEPVERPTMATVRATVRSLQASASPRPILANPLSDSPKQMPKDLPQLPSQPAGIPIPKRTSLSPGFSSPFRNTPPSPSPLSSTPPKTYTPPRSAVFSSTPPGPAIRRPTLSQGSSSSLHSLNVTQPLSSSSRIKHRPSVSSIPEQSSQTEIHGSGSSALGVNLGVPESPPKTPQTVNASNTPVRQRSSSKDGVIPRLVSTLRLNVGTSPPSNLALTKPMRAPSNISLKTSPHERSLSSSSESSVAISLRLPDSPDVSRSQPSGSPLTSSTPPKQSLAGPPRLSIESPDGDAIFAPLGSTFGRFSSILEAEEDQSSYFPTGTLQSPPFRSSEDRSEGEPSGGSISSSFPSSVDSPLGHGRSSSSSDAKPPRNQLLNFNNLDLSIHVSRKGNGAVTAASLGGLIDCLLRGTQATDGPARDKFLDTFLTTHILFASTSDVLKLLLYRFMVAESDQDLHPQKRADMKYRVLMILEQWLKGHYAKILEMHHLEDLRSFLLDIISPSVFVSRARELIKAIDYLMATHPSRATSPTFSHTGTRRSVRPSEVSPTGLAIALSALEGRRYRAITATDCVSYLLHKDSASGVASSNKVAEARITNNKILHWVKKSVLRSDKLESREDTLKFFINTAAECRKLNNYSSMSALLGGIDSPQLLRLKLTRGRLDKPSRDTLRRLSGLQEINHNHRAYRDALPDPTKASCLPYLAVHLKDLQLVYERGSNRIQLGEQSLINFEKFSHVHDSIRSLLAFQEHESRDVSMDGERKAGPLLYLEEQLATISLGRAAENKLEDRSLELQKLEDRDYENRVPELAAVGFKTSRGR